MMDKLSRHHHANNEKFFFALRGDSITKPILYGRKYIVTRRINNKLKITDNPIVINGTLMTLNVKQKKLFTELKN